MRHLTPLICVAGFAVSFTAATGAQTTTPGTAVDPNVGDRGANATSLRFVDPGNAQHSFAARLTVADFRSTWSAFNPPDNPIATDPATGLSHSQNFRYTAPGVRALMDRPDYLVDVGGPTPGFNVQPNADGAQALIIPANTVFQLTLDRPRPAADAPAPTAGNFVDLRRSPVPQQAVPRQNAVHFSVDGTTHSGQAIDAAQLRFPAAALAAQPRAISEPAITPMPRNDLATPDETSDE